MSHFVDEICSDLIDVVSTLICFGFSVCKSAAFPVSVDIPEHKLVKCDSKKLDVMMGIIFRGNWPS